MKLLIFCLLFCTSFRMTAQQSDTNYVIFSDKASIESTDFSVGSKPAQLNGEEIKQLNTLIVNCIDQHNIKQEGLYKKIKKEDPKARKKDFVIDLKGYKRQYVAIINSNGEKEVWVNCFCFVFGKWRKEIMSMKDGGNCFFNLKVNLTKEKYYDLSVNGDA